MLMNHSKMLTMLTEKSLKLVVTQDDLLKLENQFESPR